MCCKIFMQEVNQSHLLYLDSYPTAFSKLRVSEENCSLEISLKNVKIIQDYFMLCHFKKASWSTGILKSKYGITYLEKK